MEALHTEAFSRKLKGWIENHNLTQKEFAQAAGLSPSMLSNWLNGTVQPEELTRLMAVADTTQTDLFEWVALLTGREYRYEAATRNLRQENETLKAEIARLRAEQTAR